MYTKIATEEFKCKTCDTFIKVGDEHETAFEMCADPWDLCSDCYEQYLNSCW